VSVAGRLLLTLAANAGLAVALAVLLATPVDVSPILPTEQHRLALADESSGPDEAGRLDFSGLDRNQVIARPLFSMERRPWQPPPEPAAAPVAAVAPEPEQVQDVVLLGVGIAGGRARALLMRADGTESAWVTEGETIWDWTIGEISDQSVAIEHGDRDLSLRLYPTASGN
jgi:hypothetical protein